jgi:hypothetical protein
MKHKNAEVAHAFLDGIECEGWLEYSQKWFEILNLADFNKFETVRIKPKPDWTEERTLFWNKCVNFVAYDSMGSEWLKDGKHYTKLGNFKLTFDGETGKLKSAEVI